MKPSRTQTGTAARPAEKLSRQRQRQRLIDACISALYLHGPSRTTIDKVVTIADMSPGIVNFYFETKAALLVAALEHLAVEFEEQVLAPVEALRATPLRALERLIELYLDPEIASPRKVSVWYAFWGESSSRSEYYAICGQRDVAFTALVGDLIGQLIALSATSHLDQDAVALGLIGALEMMWQDIAFQAESDIDRPRARARCMAYLRSVFPAQVGQVAALPALPAPAAAPLPGWAYTDHAQWPRERLMAFGTQWHIVAHEADLAITGDYLTMDCAGTPLLALRDASGRFRVLRNACLRRPHMLTQQSAGQFAGHICCEADGLAYELNGHCPSLAADLPIFPSVVVDGWIFVSLQAIATEPPHLGGSAARPLRPAGAWGCRTIAADWKVMVEIWAQFCASALPIDHSAYGIIRREPTAPGEGWAARAYASLRTPGAAAWSWQLYWPNLLVETRPDGISLMQVLPDGPGLSRLRTRHYAWGTDDRTGRALHYLARRIGQARIARDIAIACSTQRGLAAVGFEPCSASDDPAWVFWGWLRGVMPGGFYER